MLRSAKSVHRCNGASVLRVGLLARPDNRRALFAVTDRRDTSRGNAHCNENVFSGLCAALAQGEVVLARASLVAMSFDRDRDIWIAPQPIGLPGKDLLSLGCYVGPVEGEEHTIPGTSFQILLR